jgi:hypothetical protein
MIFSRYTTMTGQGTARGERKLSRKERSLEEPPLNRCGESIIFCQNLEVSPGMLADRTLIRDIPPFKDKAAIPAVPFHKGILFECFPFLHIF